MEERESPDQERQHDLFWERLRADDARGPIRRSCEAGYVKEQLHSQNLPTTGLLRWNMDGLALAMGLTAPEVRAYFTDGRRVSFILERRIAR